MRSITLIIISSLIWVGCVFNSNSQNPSSKQDSILHWIKLSNDNKLEYNDRIAYAQKALAFNEEKGGIVELEANYSLGAIALKQANYNEALENLQKAYSLAQKDKQTKEIAKISYLIGNVYNYLNDQNQASKYFEEAMLSFENNKDTIGTAHVLNSLGIIYAKQKKYSEAIQSYEQSLALYKLIGAEEFMTYPLNNIGDYHFHQGQFELALVDFERSLAINQKYKNIKEESIALCNIGWVYRELGDYPKAIQLFKSSLNIAIPEGFDKVVYDNYKDLADTYEEIGKFEQAFHYYKEYSELKDSVLGKETQEQVAYLRVQFETEKKETALQEAKEDVGELIAQGELNQWKVYGISLGLVVVLIGAFFVFFKLNNRIKEKRELIEKNKELHETQQQLMKSELKNKELQNSKLAEELDYKNDDLVNFALDIARKNEFAAKMLTGLEIIEKLKGADLKKKLRELTSFTQNHLKINDDLESFQMNVEKVNQDFFNQLSIKFPDLTSGERYLCGLIRLNLTIKDIAAMRNISPKTVEMARYRLRKKLELESSDDLNVFLQNL